MKLKFFLVISLLFVLVSSVFFAAGEPDRFFLRFSDGKMVVVPSTGTKQISAQNMVLSYCTDWEMVQVYPYLFHLRLNTWSGFFWSVNTSRKQVYKVDGGTFGGIGGTHTTLNISVEPVGGSVTVSPERFALNFSNSYLVYKPATGLMQLVAENYVLSYCANWQAVKMQSYLYHLRLSTWVGFYWKVNTDRKEAYKVVGANFSSLGGALQRINLVVDVVN